jgi:hypothetical protein
MRHQPPNVSIDAGGEPSGMPPTETGPTGLRSRDIFLCEILVNRVRAPGSGIEEVVSDRESTFAMSVES